MWCWQDNTRTENGEFISHLTHMTSSWHHDNKTCWQIPQTQQHHLHFQGMTLQNGAKGEDMSTVTQYNTATWCMLTKPRHVTNHLLTHNAGLYMAWSNLASSAPDTSCFSPGEKSPSLKFYENVRNLLSFALLSWNFMTLSTKCHHACSPKCA